MKTKEKAAQLWPILVSYAQKGKTVTYGAIAAEVGGIARGVGKTLTKIEALCIRKKLPPLTVLVVQKKTGRPGPGFRATADIEGTQARVFDYDWTSCACPAPTDFS